VPQACTRYRPRTTQDSAVVRVLREHLDELLERVEADADRRLPAFVVKQLRSMISCGDFLRGFARFECTACRAPLVVPFSCKSRVCPSCSARRMSEQAAHMVDRILPGDVPYRQWVVTFPWNLARRLAFDSELTSAVIRLVIRVLFAWLRERSPAQRHHSHPGAVVFVQRFSDAAGLFVHLHIIMPDGVFVGGPAASELPFADVAPPEHKDIRDLALQLHQRILGLLRRRGLLDADHEEPDDDGSEPDDAQLMLACAAAAPSQKVVEGPQHKPAKPSRHTRRTALKASHGGFELHAGVVVDAYETSALERLVRYLARPPVPAERVHLRKDGKVVFDLKRAKKGNVRQLVFEPLAFLARLVALVPPPRFHLTRFFGVFSSGCLYRPLVVPVPPLPDDPDRPVAPKRPKSMAWSDLIRRVFLIDVLQCECGGRYRYVATIRDPDVVQAILAAIALRETSRAPPTRAQRRRRRRTRQHRPS
jgi:hypothetical protein